MNEDVKISIIIPCYNMEQYLSECLASIWNQTLKDIEVICIDDASTDGTLELLINYRKNDERLVVLKQQHQGSGNARNFGIEKARGQYIAFMDADDLYPEVDTLERLYELAIEKELDICGGAICFIQDGCFIYDAKTKFDRELTRKQEGYKNKEDFSTYGGYQRYIYRREFLKEHNIQFPNYLRFQDPPFFLEAICRARKIYVFPRVTYCYRKNHKEIIFDSQKSLDMAKGIRDSIEIAYKEGLEQVYECLIENLYEEWCIAMLYRVAANDSQEMKIIIHEINQYIKSVNDEWFRHDRLLLEDEELDDYVRKIKENKESALGKISSYSKILVYGAGKIGKKVMRFLCSNGIEPEAFVVSDISKNTRFLDGKVVREINEYLFLKEECLIIIATARDSQSEIIMLLKQLGFSNIYPIDVQQFYILEDVITL